MRIKREDSGGTLPKPHSCIKASLIFEYFVGRVTLNTIIRTDQTLDTGLR